MSYKNVLIETGAQQDQAERDQLPDWERARGKADELRRQRHGLDWRVGLAIVLCLFTIGVYLLTRFLAYMADVSYQTAWLDVWLIALLKIGLFAAPLVFLALGTFWLYQKASAAGIVRLQNNMPLARRHIERDTWQPAAIASLDAFYRTEQEWARHSGLRSLNQLDMSGRLPAPMAPLQPEPSPLPPLLPANQPIIEALRERGHISRSGESLMIGYGEGEKPAYLRWGRAGLSAVAGMSGSGKTSTIRFVAAQHAMNGGALVICDPHGAQSEESLARSCDALAGAFLFPPAIDHDSILALIRQIDRIGRDRLSGHDTSTTPILLLIDEFTSLARNHPQAGDIVNALLNFGDEYRKVNLMAFLIGHHWRGDLIDPRLGSSLRSAIGARVIHRSAPNEARFLLQSEEAQGVDRLLPGHVLFFDASDRAQRLAVPYVDGAALAVAARYIPDHPEWPMPCPDLSESAGPAVSTQDRTADRDLLAALLLRNGLPVRQVASIVRDAGHTIDNNRLSELREVAAAMHNAPDAPVALQEGSGEAADATHEQSGISCPHCGNQLESNAHLGAAKRHGYCKHCKPNRQ